MDKRFTVAAGCKGAVVWVVLMALLWAIKDMTRAEAMMRLFNVVNYPVMMLVAYIGKNILYGERVMPVILPLIFLYWISVGFIGGIAVRAIRQMNRLHHPENSD